MAKGRAGRPSEYQAEYANQAKKLCLLGATDKDLADFFGVAEQTINNWKQRHTEFLESIRAGKEIADAEVADRLYQRARGYEHDEAKVFQYRGEIVQATVRRHYPPDTLAAQFWLKNRQPARWRDRQHVEHSGEVGIRQLLDEIDNAPQSSPMERLARQHAERERGDGGAAD